MLNQEFITQGFRFINSSFYLTKDNLASIHDLKKIFDINLQEDGFDFRKRAYLKLILENKEIRIAENQTYYQTASSNNVDGGKLRLFKVMNDDILEIPLIQTILAKNLEMIECYPLLQKDKLTIGLHFIRYEVSESRASYSSPEWLHKDDEPLVFIHLINLSKSAIGGDNLIADSHSKKITHVVRLENEIDTLALNQNVYHAVTPLGSKQGIATRDVILFTVEPCLTQHDHLNLI